MYTAEFRRATLLVYEAFGGMRRTAKVMNVSVASISRWLRLNTTSRQPRQARPSKISSAVEAYIHSHVLQYPASTCTTLSQEIRRVFAMNVSRQWINVILRRLGYTRKRTRKRGVGRQTEERRREFFSAWAALQDESDSSKLVALDESGFDQRPRPIYGYAPKGKLAIVKVKPNSDRNHFSLLMAISGDGTSVQDLHTTSVTGPIIADFIKRLPSPDGSTVLLDNAAIHRTHAVRLAAQSRNFKLLFIPPYSPEYNPIELVFGSIKQAFYRSRYLPSFNSSTSVRDVIQYCVRQRTTYRAVCGSFRHVAQLIQNDLANSIVASG